MVLDSGSRFLVSKSDLAQARIALDADAPAVRPLQEGEARLAIRHFAFGAGNAASGALQRWQLFPCEDDAWGCIPAWGFATVSESRRAGVDIGARIYGCLPMGTHLVVQPAQAGRHGFIDGAPHRSALPAACRQYLVCEADPLYDAEREALLALLKPSFVDAFRIDRALAAAEFFGARRVLLSNAGRMAACATAYCLAQRAGRPRVVGLSAAANAAFARSLGCWDEVAPYDALPALTRDERTVYIDFTGSAPLRERVRAHFGDALAPGAVGATPPAGSNIEDLPPHLVTAWKAFIQHVDDPRNRWLHVREARGAAAVEAVYRTLLAGRGDPSDGWMLAL